MDDSDVCLCFPDDDDRVAGGGEEPLEPGRSEGPRPGLLWLEDRPPPPPPPLRLLMARLSTNQLTAEVEPRLKPENGLER